MVFSIKAHRYKAHWLGFYFERDNRKLSVCFTGAALTQVRLGILHTTTLEGECSTRSQPYCKYTL